MLRFPRRLYENAFMGIPARKIAYVVVGVILAMLLGLVLLRGMPWPLRLVVSFLVAALGFLLAFYRPGGVDLDLYVIYYLKSLITPGVYIWQKGKPEEVKPPPASPPPEERKLPARVESEAFAVPAPFIMAVNLVILLAFALVVAWGVKAVSHRVPMFW